ncbi:UNVERIFIED_CONTAM: hypothetical protein K2H54_068631 [Gekko kuhli]
MKLAGTLRHRLEQQNTHIRPAIPVEKRLAITLWYLANQGYFREIRHLFGVGLSTAFIITKEVCQAILEELFKKKVCLGNQVGSVHRLWAEEVLGNSFFWHLIPEGDGSCNLPPRPQQSFPFEDLM